MLMVAEWNKQGPLKNNKSILPLPYLPPLYSEVSLDNVFGQPVFASWRGQGTQAKNMFGPWETLHSICLFGFQISQPERWTKLTCNSHSAGLWRAKQLNWQ